VMGLLRAFAEAVLVGAGTVRAEGGKALWTPDYIFPAAAKAFAQGADCSPCASCAAVPAISLAYFGAIVRG